ncbi:MAG: flagellar basal body rod protein FlgC [Solirubrobacteraceae bacterium]
MSFFDAINISATGLTATTTEMDVTAENLANAQSTNNGNPYKPQAVELSTIGSNNSFQAQLAGAMGSGNTDSQVGGVEVSGIVSENVPNQQVYDPGSPDANAKGYVEEPDIQPVTEMTNLISESDSYQADVTAMDTTKQMYTSALNLLQL